MKTKCLYSLLFLLVFFQALAQKKLENAYHLHITFSDSLPNGIKWKNNLKDSVSVHDELFNLQQNLQKKSYILASIDSLAFDSSSCSAYVYIGKSYENIKLENGNIKENYWNKTSKQRKFLSLKNLQKHEKSLLQFYENNGFPFAQIYVDSINNVNGQFYAKVFCKPNDSIVIDSLVVHGNTKTKSKFLQRYLNIAANDMYNQQKLNAIAKKLQQLPYLHETKPSTLSFTPGKASIHIYLEKQKSNQFNLILGVLPNTQLTTNRKVTVTGDGKLHLLNSFGVGEEIYADFKQLKPRTQNLDIKFAYPFILNSPIGTFGSFNLYKNDTLFVDINSSVGLQYQFGGFHAFKAYFTNETSNILNVDTAIIKNSKQLPNTLDLRNNSYGLSLHLQRVNYVLNPRSGYLFDIGAKAGVQKIKVNQNIASLLAYDGTHIANLYDSLQLKKINYGLNFGISGFIPLRKRSTFLLQNQTEIYIAKNILNNEKFRIGGYKSIRGFDEEAIYTPFYSIFTAEYRFLLSKNSFFNMFYDWAIVENELKGSGHVDIPMGFGLGVALETRGGIFSLSYALGKNLNNNIQFKNGKIHFGFVSLF